MKFLSTIFTVSLLATSVAQATNSYVADLNLLGTTTLELIDANTDRSQYLLKIHVDEVRLNRDGTTTFMNVRGESPRAYIHFDYAEEFCRILGYSTADDADLRDIGFFERNIRTPVMITFNGKRVSASTNTELVAFRSVSCRK